MQSKGASLVESVVNTGVGVIINTLVQVLCFPFFGIPITLVKMGSLSIIFAALSVIRNFVLRRLFNRWKKGKQTKFMSSVEATTNTVAGIVLGFAVQFPLFYWFGFKVSALDIGIITLIFAVVGMGKNYVLRRLFIWVDTGLIQRKIDIIVKRLPWK